MLVVFDLDGTLVDSSQSLLKAHELAWKSCGLACPPASDILNLVGLPLLETMQILSPQSDSHALARAYSKAYAQTSLEHEHLFKGIKELLQEPFRAAVATGKSQRGAESAVERHGLHGRFEIVLGGNSVPRPKPYPDMLWAIMEATGERDLLMIGDTTYDLEMAHNAGAKAVGVSWGHHKSKKLQEWASVVDSVEELCDKIQAFIADPDLQ
jgi:phosphoglycolate phosphatase